MIRVLIADDHPIVREGMRRVLEGAADIGVVAEADSGEGLAALVTRTQADVVVLDISMPGPDFLELIGAIRVARPGVHVLILSAYPEGEYAIHALRAGAAGYVSKLDATEQLVTAVRRVHDGRRYITDSLAERLVAGVVDHALPPHTRLSPREFEVLRLMAAGRSLKEIAGTLAIHPKTVSTFRARVLQKLGVKTNADLVRYALQHDLTAEGSDPRLLR